EALRLRRDDHALADLGRARGREPLRALDLDEAQPARAERLLAVGRAELRNVDPRFGRRAQHGRALRHGHGFTVDRERDQTLRLALRRAEIPGSSIRFECCTHATSPMARRSASRARKSSGKWARMLKTGYGAMPPSAHSEPAIIVSQSSRSSVRFAVSLTPPRIRSMTSTPRTAPIRHGVHLPQDSIAQNSIAKRACWPMSTVSSNTTIPPRPIIAP